MLLMGALWMGCPRATATRHVAASLVLGVAKVDLVAPCTAILAAGEVIDRVTSSTSSSSPPSSLSEMSEEASSWVG